MSTQDEAIVDFHLTDIQAADLLDFVDVFRDPVHGDVRVTPLELDPHQA